MMSRTSPASDSEAGALVVSRAGKKVTATVTGGRSFGCAGDASGAMAAEVPVIALLSRTVLEQGADDAVAANVPAPLRFIHGRA
jgi:hypothetical protein